MLEGNRSNASPQNSFIESFPPIWQQIVTGLPIHSYLRNKHVIYHGSAASSLWLVVKGWVKLVRQTPDGKETIIGLCSHGDIFGEAALFQHANYPYNAEVIEDGTELLSLPADSLRRSLEENPSLSNNIISLLNERVAQTQLKLEHMNTLSTAQRLGCFLLRLCKVPHNENQILQIPVEKHVLASYLGMKPETLSRSQQQLREIGITINGSQVNISNVGKLQDFVCNSCSQSGSCDS